MKAQWIAVSVLLVLVTSALVGAVDSARGWAPADVVVYDDGLAAGWDDWSWGGITRDFANASPVQAGTDSVAVTYTGGWSGLQLGYHDAYLDADAYDTLRFWVHGGAAGGQQVVVTIVLQSGEISQAITPQANTWTQVDVSLLDHHQRQVHNIQWFNNTAGAQPTFYLDEVAFVDTGAPPPTPTPPEPGPALSVDAAADRHPISPYVYGMNFCDEELADELGLPVRRRGGNSTTRYNWQLDMRNTGLDWYFENVPYSNPNPELLPDGSSADLFVEQDRGTGTKTLLTIPLIGWTPKRRLAGHPFDCGFKESVYGAQDSVDPWDTDCGNGEQGGVPITTNDPTDTSVAITTTFVISWVNHLTGKYGTAADGGVMFYNLDNEPMLWNDTHRDVHPDPVDYDEMRDRTYEYGAAIKAADPSAQTLGPVVWGWCAYLYSAADGCFPGSDRASHGNMDFTPWYLQQMAAYEGTYGLRILDYLDLHSYPNVNGVFSENEGNASVQALRLRSTRRFWDPTYVDEGWVGQPVYLIPRMQQWITDNYPGTKTAITEYNWGALGYMNGALAQADLLGIFGREGLDLATLWDPPDADQPGAYAFRMYLNYDGLGSGFGETSVHAASTDQGKVAIYAARRSSDAALTLMVINKTGGPLTSTVTLANVAPVASAQVYRYSAADLDEIVRAADQPVTASGFTATFPANSITLLVVPTLSEPDLTPSYKAVSSPFADSGEQVTYTVVIRNGTGPVTPTVLFTDTVPGGLSYISGTLTATMGTVTDAGAPTLRWSGVLTPTPAVTVTYAVTVTATAPQIITNAAIIAIQNYEPITRTATLRTNWLRVYLPLLMRDY